MPSKYFQPGQARAEKVADLFGVIAPRYDLINDLQSFGLHRLWKRRLVNLARPQAGERALDLCCGTGDVALALSAAGAGVAGLDFSAAMLSVAQERARNRRLQEPPSRGGSCEFVRADAQQLPFPDGCFEIVTISYGLRNLADWRRGLGEMWRVTRPGGRLLVLDFARPDSRLWRGLYLGYLRFVVPVFGWLICRDAEAYGYILESLRHYPGPQVLAEQLRSLGASPVRVFNLLGGVMTIHYGGKQTMPETPPLPHVTLHRTQRSSASNRPVAPGNLER